MENMENARHVEIVATHQIYMWFFHSYVKSPKGRLKYVLLSLLGTRRSHD